MENKSNMIRLFKPTTIKNIIEYFREISRLIFVILIIIYLLSLIVDNYWEGFFSSTFSLNIILLMTVIAGIFTIITGEGRKSKFNVNIQSNFKRNFLKMPLVLFITLLVIVMTVNVFENIEFFEIILTILIGILSALIISILFINE
ncbi:hypothetical protein KKC06_00120 [Patescibacteria group bacterium]|nr:hypothetical protein [Patescibacteria group bacterium]